MKFHSVCKVLYYTERQGTKMNKKMLISLLLTGTLLLSTGSVLAEELQPDDIGSTDSPSGESQEIITDFASEEEMISSMKPAAENSRFQMYTMKKQWRSRFGIKSLAK